MIVKTVKYLIVGAKEDLDRFFEKAQHHGFLEFISIRGKKAFEPPATVQSLLDAIKILRRQPFHAVYEGGGDLPLAMQVAQRILDIKSDLEKLLEEKRLLESEITRILPLGDFSLEEIAEIEKKGKRKIQFFCMKSNKTLRRELPQELIYVNTEYDLDYFMGISREGLHLPEMISMRIDASLSDLKDRHQFVVQAIHDFEMELKSYAGHQTFLQEVLIDELNRYHLSCAKKEVSYPLENSLFAIEAWLPETKVTILFSLIDSLAVHVEQISIEEEDRVPTCMENKNLSLVGEDIVKIYDIPATTDRDPSLWVFWCFVLFFSIIVADGGYGAVLLLLSLILKWKLPHLKGFGKRMLKLSFILSTGCLIWGILTAAYFGLKIEPGTFLSRISVLHYLAEKKAAYHLDVKDDVYQAWIHKCPELSQAEHGRQFLQGTTEVRKTTLCYPMFEEFSGNIMMEVMLVIAIVHLSLGLLRYIGRNIAGLGWIAFMVGGYLYFPKILDATTMANFMGLISKPEAAALGLQLIYGGMGFAVVSALIQKRMKGIGEIATVVQVFADVLSYLRLYALGLAGAIMAATFNIEGMNLGLFAGALVILAGHVLTIVLALMGGVIHGLRLNFIEWYHYCFDGGGRLLRPLYKLKLK